jgi:PIN domain nuclease of toxin-antitoxin system
MILLDTHVLIWLLGEEQKLSAKAKQAMKDDPQWSISSITLWELAWLAQSGRIVTGQSVETFVRECSRKTDIIPITAAVAARAVVFPDSYPRDPHDRLIGATALVEGIPLVTSDNAIRKSRLVPTIW